jgi:outer membrane protein assembly factor BamB
MDRLPLRRGNSALSTPKNRTLGFSLGGSVLPTLIFSCTTFVISQAFTLPSQQSENTAALLVTPSSLALLAGENARLSAVDASGRPVANVRWSIYPAVADLQTEDGEVDVHAKQSGHAILTATAEDHTASASITVAPGDTLPRGTVRWSLDPLPGYETLSVAQAVLGSESGMAFYSVEWSKSSNAIVRALRDTGQQVWMTHLSSTASPVTLKHALPQPGEVFFNQARISDHSQFIIGDKSAFALNNSIDPSFYNLPADGKWILIGYSPDESGGIILLERGRFQDSLVDLAPADGRESWRYRSEGRLSKNWTIHYSGDVGIVETLKQPASSALLILAADTGQVRFRISLAFPLRLRVHL